MTVFEKDVLTANKANIKRIADALERIAKVLEERK